MTRYKLVRTTTLRTVSAKTLRVNFNIKENSSVMGKKRTPSCLPKLPSPMPTVTALHGTSQLAFLKGNKLIIWKLLLILNIFITFGFILAIKNRYNNDQIITRIGNKCQLNQIPFPAVSICNFNMVSKRESRAIIQILKRHNYTENEISQFLLNLPNLKDYGKSVNGVSNFNEIMAIIKKHYYTVESLMEEVHQKCDRLLLYCTFNRKIKNCAEIFRMIKTFEGHCCTFNYAALNDDSQIPESGRDDVEYYDDPSGEDVKTNKPIIVTSESGRGSGLSVIIDVETNDYPSWSTLPYYGAKILLSDPNDYPETTISYKYVSAGESLDMKVQPMVFQSEDDVRKVSPGMRACWFHDEAVLEYTDRYSYETCLTECKMQNFLKYCGCVPYKYPIEKSTRICEFENLRCLNNVTAYISEEQRACDPICYMECRDKRYSVTGDVTPFVPRLYPPASTKDRNVSELSAVRVYFARSSCSSYKLMLLMDFNYFIATYGGIFSLSFGASILTVLEVIYLFLSFICKLLFEYIKT